MQKSLSLWRPLGSCATLRLTRMNSAAKCSAEDQALNTPTRRPDRIPITRGNCMREYLMPILVVASLVLAGCNQSKSPEDVSKDVAKAEQKATSEVTKSEE